MTCESIQEQISMLLDHELPLPETQAVFAHLAACSSCAGFYSQAATISMRMRKQELPATPGSLDDRMHRALAARREPPRRVRGYLPDRMRAFVQRRLVVPVPVAVAVFIASLGLSLILLRSVSPALFPAETVTKIVVAYPAVEVIAEQPMTN